MINEETFKLTEKNFHSEVTPKTQILLMDTQNTGMTHYEEWIHKNSLGYKKVTNYTITKDGSIFEHFSPEYYGTIFGIDEIDKKIISISLENEGWLEYSRKKSEFINWRGNIYEDKDGVHITQWRGRLFWVPYSEHQLNSLIYLLDHLCEQYEITRQIIDTNVCVDMVENYMGIISKSNYSRFCTDINPSLDLKLLKEKI